MNKLILSFLMTAKFLCSSPLALGKTKAVDFKPQKRFSIGIPGFMHHPTNDITFYFTSDYIGSLKTQKSSSQTVNYYYSNQTIEQTTSSHKHRDIEIAAHFKPFNSGFFVGLSGSKGTKGFYHQDIMNGSTMRDTYSPTTKVLSVGLPIGWTWMWENGLTVMIDAGPRMDFYQRKLRERTPVEIALTPSNVHIDSDFSCFIGYSW